MFKKISHAFVMAMVITALLCTPVMAQQWAGSKNTLPFTTLQSLVTSTTGTGATNDAVNLGIPFPVLTCLVSHISGTTPTSVVFSVKGSINGTDYVTLTQHTSTTFPDLFTLRSTTAPPVTSMRGSWDLRTGGTTTTYMQLDCMASH